MKAAVRKILYWRLVYGRTKGLNGMNKKRFQRRIRNNSCLEEKNKVFTTVQSNNFPTQLL